MESDSQPSRHVVGPKIIPWMAISEMNEPIPTSHARRVRTADLTWPEDCAREFDIFLPIKVGAFDGLKDI